MSALRFRHEFPLSIPSSREPVKAVADLRVHLGVPEMDRVLVFLPGKGGSQSVVTVGPRTDIARRASREIRGTQAGAIRQRAFELATADAELTLNAGF